jgi:hypothetical protein
MFGVKLHERKVGKPLRALGYVSVLPEHARGGPLEIWFQDEARIGQQGTLTRIWTPSRHGFRPPWVAAEHARHDNLVLRCLCLLAEGRSRKRRCPVTSTSIECPKRKSKTSS